MNRRQLLAAETFHYSYAHYADHLGVNIRFDKWMPRDVDTLERAEQEGWDDSRLAQALMEEEGLCAVIQPFEKGGMFRYNAEEHSDEVMEKCQARLSEDLYKFYWPRENVRVAITLYTDHSWQSYK